MSHDAQVIRALKSAVEDYKLAAIQREKAIQLQKEAILHLRTVVAHMIPHTTYTDEEKATLTASLTKSEEPTNEH